jgi:heat shock protein HslJ
MTGSSYRWQPRNPSRRPVRRGISGAAVTRIAQVAGVVFAIGVGLVSCTLARTAPDGAPSAPPGMTSPEVRPSPEAPAARTTWVLTSATLRGRPIPLLPDHPITLVLGARELSGVSACNSYWADLQRADGSLRLSNIRTTIMRCQGDAVMATDELFLDAIPLVREIDDGSPDRLVLEGPEVRLVFAPLPVEGRDG